MPTQGPTVADKTRERRTCSACGRIIATQRGKGSITSWIFQEKHCVCNAGAQKDAAGLRQLDITVSKRAFEPLSERYTSFQTADGEVSLRDSQPGDIISGKYKILAVTGRGGMSIVYKSEELETGRIFALKTLQPQEIPDAAWKRFEKEAQTASDFDHINLVKVHDFGLIDEVRPYMVMDYVDGPTLADLIAERGPVSVQQALEIFAQVCDGLFYAHWHGVIHRDMKPSNIMLTRNVDTNEPLVKIVDFGIAKLTLPEEGDQSLALTQTGEIFGSPLYMSPEQCLGSAIDRRSDIYSLGCALFEALTGAPPFSGKTALLIMQKHQQDSPPTLREGSMGTVFPDDLERVVQLMLEKEPSNRYQNANMLKSDLLSIMNDQPIQMRSRTTSQTQADGWSVTLDALKMTALVASVAVVSAGATLLGINLTAKPLLPALQTTPTSTPELASLRVNESSYRLLGAATGAQDFFSYSADGSRTFHFPDNVSLGKLDAGGGKNHWSAKAVGVVKVPLSAKLRFEPGWDIIVNPTLFRKFRPDDLDSIYFHGGPTCDDTMVFLDHLAGLHELIISKPIISGGTDMITDKTMSYIAGLPGLIGFGMLGTDVTQDGILKLKRLRELELLVLSDMQSVSRVLEAVKKPGKIKRLKLRRCSLTTADLKTIAEMKQLVELGLDDHKGVDDNTLPIIANLPNLEILSISRCGVTAKSIPVLQRLRNLKVLSLSANAWSPEELNAIRAAIPGVAIEKFYSAQQVTNDHAPGSPALDLLRTPMRR